MLAYLETGNASEAYRRAYDVSKMLSTTVNNKASEMMRNVSIRDRLTELQERSVATAVIDRAGVLALITELATADANQLAQVQVRCCRHCWGHEFGYQWKSEAEFGIALAAAMDREGAAVRAWQRDVDLGSQRPAPDSEPLPNALGGYGFDVYASPNLECPHCLGEGHVMPVIKDTRKLKGAAKRLYAGFKQTKDGIEIKMRDQSHALSLLAKEFGIAKDAPAVQVLQAVNAQGAENVTVISVDPLEASRQYQELMKGG